MILRPHQSRDLQALRALYAAGHKKVVYVAPTGSGKTCTSSELMRLSVAKGKRVIFVVHLRTLVGQCSDRLRSFDIPHGVIMAGHAPSDHPIQVCSRDTLLARDNRPAAGLVILDEAHHASGEKYGEILSWYPDAHILGLTATPVRDNGRGLGDVFQALHCSLSPQDLTDQGWLVPARVYAPSTPDLGSVETTAGDFAKGQLADVCMKPKLVGDLPEHWLRLAAGKRSVYFAVSLKHSRAIVESFLARGIPAAHLDANSSDDERRHVLGLLERRELMVVSNVGLFTEGADFPWVECIGLARPTHSLGLYIQMLGRGARSFDGKSEFIVLDHSNATRMHGFLTDEREWSLDMGPRKVRKGQAEIQTRVRLCLDCFRAYDAKEKACPGCGKIPTKKEREIETKQGGLVEVKQGQLKKEKGRLSPHPKVRKLQLIQREFNFKTGWLWRQLQAIANGRDPDIPARARRIWEDRAA